MLKKGGGQNHQHPPLGVFKQVAFEYEKKPKKHPLEGQNQSFLFFLFFLGPVKGRVEFFLKEETPFGG